MSAQNDLTIKYGLPNAAYIKKFCTVWDVDDEFPWFPVGHFMVNRDFMVVLRKAFKALEAAGLHKEIKTFDGCYNDRSVRGSGAISLHAWAVACDFNAADNGMVVNPTPTQRMGKWSQAFIDTMKGAGLFFGGDFRRRADPMHFGYLNG
jgi:hypothetical protein